MNPLYPPNPIPPRPALVELAGDNNPAAAAAAAAAAGAGDASDGPQPNQPHVRNEPVQCCQWLVPLLIVLTLVTFVVAVLIWPCHAQPKGSRFDQVRT